ncbi:uncharacterized protein T551_00789 [Pneumocystis jirovecii RU7]|uniref:Histone acetyltransferase GCN5 n=1 Tax=Pneumocystis jirovecii (strain RU7) TaxID=1408657 RepID=A0A0W4ZUQ0_PNEJ7|nr:uncharacterized protein T551_00789 [Pneumocystis jirovecii RU7]KTW32107.1 hypothetical protein T551_00789 [Pneumocystis jirovecii RU7]
MPLNKDIENTVLTYPFPCDGSFEISDIQKFMIVARHSSCSYNDCTCLGWKPIDNPNKIIKRECIKCGHTIYQHVGEVDIESDAKDEFFRKVKVANRCDELLNENGMLFDFDYINDDIKSLRKQMILPSDSLGFNRSLKRGYSVDESLSSFKKYKNFQENMNDNDAEVDENDSRCNCYTFSIKEKPVVIEERQGLIEFRVVNNDNSRDNLIILTGLKNIFQKQLPKMPREYIARLIYDRNHLSMAIVKKPLTVVGGITYRPFYHRRFAEIVFCAITSSEQVKGYGSHLMNHLKDYVKGTSSIMHFLTYADNYAIGYFKKQGFSKDITLDKPIWIGYIKDYEGGTIMQCTMLSRVRYLESSQMLAKQKYAIQEIIRKKSKSHIIYPGLDVFKKGAISIDPLSIPGLKEIGWSPEMDEFAQRPKRAVFFLTLQHLLTEMQNHPSSWPFIQPVNKDEVPDYYDVIKEPMDLSTMEFKLENDQYDSVESFLYDAKLIFNNCRSYNNETTTYYKNATKLEKFLISKIKETEYNYFT